MEVRWREDQPLDLVRLKNSLFTWRGGVRFGSVQVVATGVVEAFGEGRALRFATGAAREQRYELRHGRGGLPPLGARARVAGVAAAPRSSRAGAAACDLVLTVQEFELLKPRTEALTP